MGEGVDSFGKGEDKTTVWSSVTQDSCLSADTVFKLVITYIYVYSFILCTCVYAIPGLVTIFLYYACFS